MATVVAFHAHPDDEVLLFTPVRLLGLVVGHHRAAIRPGFTPRSAITHRISVRRFAAQKQAALAAHTSYTRGRGRSSRLARLLLALPAPVFGLLLGREWFAEPGAAPTGIRTDLLRPAPATPRRPGRGAA